jgi:hypothetical protein
MHPVSGHTSVMASRKGRLRQDKPAPLDLFPTPPWATRALFEHALPVALRQAWRVLEVKGDFIWDPCAGLTHMGAVLKEYGNCVMSDIVRHPLEGGGTTEQFGVLEADFLSAEIVKDCADWIVTNPPFASAHLFLGPALKAARKGVAFFERLQWLEGITRYREIYAIAPPSLVAPFAERAGLCEGGWDPECSTATAYAWFIWVKNINGFLSGRGLDGTFPLFLIPPGCKKALSRESDRDLAKLCLPGFVPPSERRQKRRTA